MAEDRDSGRPRIRRRVLSIFFVVHWMAVAAYVLPSTKAGVETLPAWMQPTAAIVLPRVVQATSRLALPYQDLAGVRQHWTLFAPWPAAWSSSVRVLPYFPAADGDGWVADTLTIRGPREQSYPHILNHRTHRLLFNMGYRTWGQIYRPHFAREMCRSLRDGRGRPPGGVELFSEWFLIAIPWGEAEESRVYRQRLGGWDCDAGAGEAMGPVWSVYGLPERVDTGDWPSVEWRPLEPDSADIGPGPEVVR